MSGYSSYAALARSETRDVDYRIHVHRGVSGIAVMAIHGGGIEPGTTEIAEATAAEQHTFYSFSGIKPKGNARLHITSREFDEPVGRAIARHARTVITIHGCADTIEMVYLGGRNAQLKERIRVALEQEGFPVGETSRFPGVNPKNICNINTLGMGVQLEISHGLRRRLFPEGAGPRRKPPGECFLAFVAALQGALAGE
jgi:phage replication-related protein YjqB (UPF0714/DUF867 family)